MKVTRQHEKMIIQVVDDALSHMFDVYSFDRLVDDCEDCLNDEEKEWAKDNLHVKVYNFERDRIIRRKKEGFNN